MSTIYQHPDGHSIDFTDNTLTVVSSDGMAVSVPMGAGGLRQLANGFTESDCAARAGAALSEIFLDAMLATNDQTESANLLAGALLDLIERGFSDRESELCNGPSNTEYTAPVSAADSGLPF